MPNYQAFTVHSTGKLNSVKTSVLIVNDTKAKEINAIWDTGATTSCIATSVAKDLGLIPIGVSAHNTAAGEVQCFDYIVDIVLPNNVCAKSVRVS